MRFPVHLLANLAAVHRTFALNAFTETLRSEVLFVAAGIGAAVGMLFETVEVWHVKRWHKEGGPKVGHAAFSAMTRAKGLEVVVVSR